MLETLLSNLGIIIPVAVVIIPVDLDFPVRLCQGSA